MGLEFGVQGALPPQRQAERSEHCECVQALSAETLGRACQTALDTLWHHYFTIQNNEICSIRKTGTCQWVFGGSRFLTQERKKTFLQLELSRNGWLWW